MSDSAIVKLASTLILSVKALDVLSLAIKLNARLKLNLTIRILFFLLFSFERKVTILMIKCTICDVMSVT